jgi:hypothetical protein
MAAHRLTRIAFDRYTSRPTSPINAMRSRADVDAFLLDLLEDRTFTASGLHRTRTVARVKSYGDVLREYEFHPEAKCSDAAGAPCGKQTAGLLRRRHIAIDAFDYIGRESNKLEEVEEGGVPSASDVYTVYDDPRRDEWAPIGSCDPPHPASNAVTAQMPSAVRLAVLIFTCLAPKDANAWCSGSPRGVSFRAKRPA